MNRLQKKCVIGTVGIHLLLLAILIFGPAFFNQAPKDDNTQVLDVIPANVVDAAINSGVLHAQPPPPTPIATPQPPAPTPPAPRIVQPTPPAPAPTPTLTQRLENLFKPEPPQPTADLTPAEKPAKPHQENIQINTQLVKRTAPQNSPPTDNRQDARAINNAIRNLSHDLSPATKIDMPGNASAAYANYSTVVRSVYEQALRPNIPDAVANNNENTKVRITVASNGTVLSAHIITSSGDPAWDNAVQRTLDQVTFIAPFPDGATEKERHYTISFNPQIDKSFE